MENNDSILFVNAKASIENNEVIIRNDKANEPEVVRYAWLHIDEANLMNKEGLPAYPFQLTIKK